MKIKPLKNYLVVQIIENEESTKSGIILAGTAKGDSNIAKVIETADVLDDNQDILLKGEKIIINPNAGTKVHFDGNEYLVISYEAIYAVLSY